MKIDLGLLEPVKKYKINYTRICRSTLGGRQRHCILSYNILDDTIRISMIKRTPSHNHIHLIPLFNALITDPYIQKRYLSKPIKIRDKSSFDNISYSLGEKKYLVIGGYRFNFKSKTFDLISASTKSDIIDFSIDNLSMSIVELLFLLYMIFREGMASIFIVNKVVIKGEDFLYLNLAYNKNTIKFANILMTNTDKLIDSEINKLKKEYDDTFSNIIGNECKVDYKFNDIKFSSMYGKVVTSSKSKCSDNNMLKPILLSTDIVPKSDDFKIKFFLNITSNSKKKYANHGKLFVTTESMYIINPSKDCIFNLDDVVYPTHNQYKYLLI